MIRRVWLPRASLRRRSPAGGRSRGRARGGRCGRRLVGVRLVRGPRVWCAGGCGRGRRPRRSGSGCGQWKSTSMSWTLVLTSGSGRPDLLVRARKRSSSSLLVPALPAALSSSARSSTWRLWRPLARVIAARTARSSKSLRNAASWITFASWCGVSTSLRSTSVRGTVVTGMPSRTRHVARVEAAVRVHVHAARCPPSAWHEHVNARDSAAPELHMNCGIEGGEVGAVAARQGRGHPLALLREPRLPDRVHARVPAVQPPVRRALRDRRSTRARPCTSWAVVITPC